MLLALFVLTVTTLLLGGAYVAVARPTRSSRATTSTRSARYAAAQAGIAAVHLPAQPERQLLGARARRVEPVAVPGSTDTGSTEYYTLQAAGRQHGAERTTSMCDTANPIGDDDRGRHERRPPGTFRISRPALDRRRSSATISRTIVAQYQAPSFLNYVYYTDYETLDPAALYNPSNDPPSRPTARCTTRTAAATAASPIDFVTGDMINGPLHSEDTLAICGNGRAVFGRDERTTTRSRRRGCSTEGQNGCTAPTRSTRVGHDQHDRAVADAAADQRAAAQRRPGRGYVFTGRTTIVLNGATMSVTNANGAPRLRDRCRARATASSTSRPSSAGCPVTYTPFTANTAYTGDTNCGNVYVSGNYTQLADDRHRQRHHHQRQHHPTTRGSLGTAPTGSQLLGLVANDFVRIYHPVTNRTRHDAASCGSNAVQRHRLADQPVRSTPRSSPSTTRSSSTTTTAARTLGTLHVYGAIAQLFRGPVGTSGGRSSRLPQELQLRRPPRRRREPPYFLNPVSAAWYGLARDRVRRRRRLLARSRSRLLDSPRARSRSALGSDRVEVGEHRLEGRARRSRPAPRTSRRADRRRRRRRRRAAASSAASMSASAVAPSVAALERMRCAMRASVSCSPPAARSRRSARPAGRAARGTGARSARARPGRRGPPAARRAPPCRRRRRRRRLGGRRGRASARAPRLALTARSIALASAASVTGLATKSSIPDSRQRSKSSRIAFAVTATIGIRGPPPRARARGSRASRRSRPSPASGSPSAPRRSCARSSAPSTSWPLSTASATMPEPLHLAQQHLLVDRVVLGDQDPQARRARRPAAPPRRRPPGRARPGRPRARRRGATA